jgi:hypothetical protein
MLNENAKKFVAALRSGEYKQGTKYLTSVRPEGEFDCCLGVACKLYIKDGGLLPTSRYENYVTYAGKPAWLPKPVREWLGFGSDDGNYKGSSLTSDNDTGKSFIEIADIIESEPKGLFVKS